ncbi:MFS transporter, partial [Geminicoccus flavidas]|uniref:MFS transporter n=1 Tax=Geminicoccus flavidas TaxID=2506407 RepID=UPI001359B658
AVGAPIGSALHAVGGFFAIALATTILPVAILLAILPMRGAHPAAHGMRQSFLRVAGAVWLPGFGAALSSIGYGAILTFGALHFAEHGWHPVWLPFTAYAGALIAARLCVGALPDRLGGARVATIFVLVEAAGLMLIWLAPGPVMAAVGAALTGLGYSLVYPGLGAEAVRSLHPSSRGLAMGLYTVFLDVALGVGSPALGAIAASVTVDSVFLASAMVVSCAAIIALTLARSPSVLAFQTHEASINRSNSDQ